MKANCHFSISSIQIELSVFTKMWEDRNVCRQYI